MQAYSSIQRVRFSVFEVNLDSRELRKHGVKVKLQEQPFRILSLLLSSPGGVVTREQLRRELWPEGVFVDFEKGVNTAITKLRDTLGDSSANPRFIETVPRQGYRFIAPVQIIQEAPAAAREGADAPEAAKRPADLRRGGVTEAVPSPSDTAAAQVAELRSEKARVAGTPAHKNISRLQRVFWFMAAVAVLAVLAVLVLRDRASTRAPSHDLKSLAVLPLQNLSRDPDQEYFVDGMTDALITRLAQISTLRVISRTSTMRYKDVHVSLPEIARELNVDGVVEGSVLHSGHRVRITVQLLNARLDQHLWADTFEDDDQEIIRLQDDTSRKIASQITAALSRVNLPLALERKPVSSGAYEAYLKGRYFWNKREPEGLQRSITYFEKAIDSDPNYALAYSGLADAYLMAANYNLLSQGEAYARASQAAVKASALDGSLGEPHATLGAIRAGQDWDWIAAEQEYRRAIALNPGNSTAHSWFSALLSILRRHTEAISEGEWAEQLDPVSLPVCTQTGTAFFLARRFDEAIRQYRKVLDLDDDFALAHLRLGLAYEQKGLLPEAIAELERAENLSSGGQNHTLWYNAPWLAQLDAVAGRTQEARSLLEKLKQVPANQMSASDMAMIYIALGEYEEAFRWLDKGFQVHDAGMTLISVDPRYDPLRASPRFRALLDRMHLPG